jgi:hypothetical protein
MDTGAVESASQEKLACRYTGTSTRVWPGIDLLHLFFNRLKKSNFNDFTKISTLQLLFLKTSTTLLPT